MMNKLAQLVEVLAQMNAQLMALLEHATQPSVNQVPTSAQEKQFKDILSPQLAPFCGDGKVTPEDFLTQFRLLARHYTLSREERVRQLSAKLADDTLKWFNITFGGTSDAATESQLALGLRKQFGVEYEQFGVEYVSGLSVPRSCSRATKPMLGQLASWPSNSS